VKYNNEDPSKGAAITIKNLEQMAMPVPVLIKETNGKEHMMTLPVEVWQRGSEWTFTVPTTSKIKEVILDPAKELPDVNRRNNTMSDKAF
jgi:hypothetical protein